MYTFLMAPLEITVAGLAPFPFVFEYAGSSIDFNEAVWEDLPKVVVTAEPHDTLRQVLGRAAAPLGVRLAQEAIESRRSWREAEGLPPDEGCSEST